MTRTENYQLPQWEANDPVRREDFNQAMENMEEGLNAAYSDGRVPVKYQIVSITAAAVEGDTLVKYYANPKFLIVYCAYGSLLIGSGSIDSILMSTAIDYDYRIQLQLTGNTLRLYSRGASFTSASLKVAAFF